MPIAPFVPSQKKALIGSPLFNDASLVSYWKLDETSGDATDSKGSATLTNTNVTYSSGVFENGAVFNGTSSKLVKTAYAIGIGNAYTHAGWFNPDVLDITNRTLFNIRPAAGNANNIALEGLTNGYIRAILFNSSGTNIKDYRTTSLPLSVGTFYHIAVTWNGTDFKIYVNGAEPTVTKSVDIAGSLTSTDRGVFVGNEAGTGNYWDGMIDDIYLFSRALSADEVKSLCGTTKAYFPLQGNSTDYSGNGNNGTDTAITYTPTPCRCALAANFNGSTSQISVTDNATLRPTGDFTVFSIIKTTQSPASDYPTIVQSYAQPGTVAGFEIMQRPSSLSNYLRFVVGNNTGTSQGTQWQECNSTKAFNDGKEHTCMFVHRNGAGLDLYVDGVLNNTVTWTGGVAYAATNYIRIGCNNITGSNQYFWNGSIRNVIIENRAWSAPEIAQYYRRSVRKKRRKVWFANMLGQTILILDSVTTSETVTSLRNRLITIAEIVTTSEVASTLKAMSITITDYVTTNESLSYVRSFVVNVLDTVTSSDALIQLLKKWSNTVKNVSTWTNSGKNTATFSNTSKNDSTWTNTPKN